MNNTVSAKLLIIFSIFAYFFTLTISLETIVPGNIAFWYDPARDLLLALSNLQKPTLIGPPAGIPGIFYGPYWIWLLSVGLVFSKDPRVIASIVLLLPYFTLLPILLWRLSKHWGILTVTVLGILFLINFNGYAIQLWNPHLGPLFFIWTVYLLASSELHNKTKKNIIKVFFAGITAGLLVNFHISFGISVMVGLSLFLLTECILILWKSKKKERKKTAVNAFIGIMLFYLGVFLVYGPFILFEIRHGFQQTEAAILTLLNPFATVGIWGLTDSAILHNFVGVFYRLTSISQQFFILLIVLAIGNAIYLIYKKQKLAFSNFNRKVLLIIFLSITAVLYFYLTSKNPVWEYHFIGVEILYLLALGLLSNRLLTVRLFLLCVVLFLFSTRVPQIMQTWQNPRITEGTLAAKEQVVQSIINDAHGDYVVSVYNPAIYTYDYDYLFLWKDQKEVTKSLSDITDWGYPAYLVIPQTDEGKKQDFINAQTRGIQSRKIKEWKTPDNTTIVKLDLTP